MGKMTEDVKAIAGGTIAVWAGDLLFYKGFKHVPFLNDKTILSRSILSAVGAIAVMKTTGVTRDIALVWTGHNLADTPYHVQQVHDFMGISNNMIDSVATEAVASIEASITDEITKLKEAMGGGGGVSSPMSGRAEAVEYEEYPFS